MHPFSKFNVDFGFTATVRDLNYIETIETHWKKGDKFVIGSKFGCLVR